jgi:hypothetical protein
MAVMSRPGPPPKMDSRTAQRVIERMILACHRYAKADFDLEGLERRVCGPQKEEAIRALEDTALGWLFYKLQIDFYTWKGLHNNIIHASALEIVDLTTARTTH